MGVGKLKNRFGKWIWGSEPLFPKRAYGDLGVGAQFRQIAFAGAGKLHLPADFQGASGQVTI